MSTPDLLASCRDTIGQQLQLGPPTLLRVAEAMGTSPRTLQRRLQQAGVRFSRLRDSVRRDEACLLLESSDLKITEIAARLGYPEPSSFSRAFVRITGMTPGAYRRMHLRAASSPGPAMASGPDPRGASRVMVGGSGGPA